MIKKNCFFSKSENIVRNAPKNIQKSDYNFQKNFQIVIKHNYFLCYKSHFLKHFWFKKKTDFGQKAHTLCGMPPKKFKKTIITPKRIEGLQWNLASIFFANESIFWAIEKLKKTNYFVKKAHFCAECPQKYPKNNFNFVSSSIIPIKSCQLCFFILRYFFMDVKFKKVILLKKKVHTFRGMPAKKSKKRL